MKILYYRSQKTSLLVFDKMCYVGYKFFRKEWPVKKKVSTHSDDIQIKRVRRRGKPYLVLSAKSAVHKQLLYLLFRNTKGGACSAAGRRGDSFTPRLVIQIPA